MKKILLVVAVSMFALAAQANTFKCAGADGSVTRGTFAISSNGNALTVFDSQSYAQVKFSFVHESKRSSGSIDDDYTLSSYSTDKIKSGRVFFLAKGSYYVRDMTLHYLDANDKVPSVYVTYVNDANGDWTRSFLCQGSN